MRLFRVAQDSILVEGSDAKLETWTTRQMMR